MRAGDDGAGERASRAPSDAASPSAAAASTAASASAAAVSDLDLDPRDPERSAARLIQLADEGWKFHELRRRVAALFADDAVRPPEFAARCLEYVVRARRAGRAADPNARRDPEAPFVADPVAHLFLDALPNASKSCARPGSSTSSRRRSDARDSSRAQTVSPPQRSSSRPWRAPSPTTRAAEPPPTKTPTTAPTKTLAAPRRSNPAP